VVLQYATTVYDRGNTTLFEHGLGTRLHTSQCPSPLVSFVHEYPAHLADLHAESYLPIIEGFMGILSLGDGMRGEKRREDNRQFGIGQQLIRIE
jgi:hypothetical protein